jgi:exopolysaccharide biosynthesis polyprenyl glycosylphosphotransferase
MTSLRRLSRSFAFRVAAGEIASITAACLLAAVATNELTTGYAELVDWTVMSSLVLGCILFATRSVREWPRRIAPAASDGLAPLARALLTGVLLLVTLRALDWHLGVLAQLFGVTPLATVLAGALGVIFIMVSRTALLVHRRHSRCGRARVLIVGTAGVTAELVGRLLRSGQVDVVGAADDKGGHRNPNGLSELGIEILGPIEELSELCSRHRIDRVVVGYPQSDPLSTTAQLRRLPSSVCVDVLPRYFEMTGWVSTLDDLSGICLVSAGRREASVLSLSAKRLLDITVSLVGIAICLPVLLVAAAAISVDSRGPVLFTQERLGRQRRPFVILKLRTMAVSDSGPALRRSRPDGNECDPRITRVGRLLRRYGIDELPQLLNVLWGQMSLVGPRPLVREECTDMPGWVERRFEVRPGITGLWQVSGQHALGFDELCRLDHQYATTWTLGLDLQALVRTPGRLVRGSNAEPNQKGVVLPLPSLQLQMVSSSEPLGVEHAVEMLDIGVVRSSRPVGSEIFEGSGK